jgi:hypothetical protein
MGAKALNIAVQNRIHTMVNDGYSYEQIKAACHVGSNIISRCINRRRAFHNGLVDTPYYGCNMNGSNKPYLPTPEEIAERAASIRRYNEAQKQLVGGRNRDDEDSPGIRVIETTQDSIRYRG